MALRKTVDRETVTAVANRMIAHLAASGTREDQVKREAIFEVATAILQEGNSYAGFRYLNDPVKVTRDGWDSLAYDNSRIALY